ncbi:type II toxin-antitoxin system RelE/ParE family toxin [Nitratireductor soli]|uniref:type II toxin-antitoxin system RelE/ParE family toxin n=1 Tax=Nitratireductor soli TaxID=1670619 RepID=UPI00065DBD88|nr:type II toxin-antitoxin system RelE/ParE family toxin [Nitratireductor soli]
MIEVRLSDTFTKWLDGLRDQSARIRIATRIRRMEMGNPGDVKAIGEGVSEMRITYGPGYRVYFVQDGKTIIIILCGGDKSSQSRDIAEAKRMAKEL